MDATEVIGERHLVTVSVNYEPPEYFPLADSRESTGVDVDDGVTFVAPCLADAAVETLRDCSRLVVSTTDPRATVTGFDDGPAQTLETGPSGLSRDGSLRALADHACLPATVRPDGAASVVLDVGSRSVRVGPGEGATVELPGRGDASTTTPPGPDRLEVTATNHGWLRARVEF